MYKKYLIEIKNRFALIIGGWFILTLVLFLYKEVLLDFIIKVRVNKSSNLSESYFIFTNVFEMFNVYVKIVLFFSFQYFLVFIIYHFFIFFSLALYKREYIFFLNICIANFLVLTSSMFIINFYIIPLTWSFFLGFQSLNNFHLSNFFFEEKISEYIFFYMNTYYLCVLYSQLLSILFFIFLKSGVKNVKNLRRFYYYFFIVFSTLLSPPDVFSQIFISVISICFYELCVCFLIIKFLTESFLKISLIKVVN